MYAGFRQIPFETRLIDFCFKNKMENHDPGQLINAFVNDPKVKEYQASSNDIIAMNLDVYCTFLLKKPLFIEAVEMIQSITKQIRKMQAGLQPEFKSLDEFTFLEFCMTRFLAVAPLVTILEQALFLSEGLYDQVKQYSSDVITAVSKNKVKTEITYLAEYINRLIIAPYSGSIKVQGSSLIGSLKSVMAVDLPTVWADVLAGR